MSVGGGVEMGVCECGKAWHILDTGGRCACTSAKVGVCVCVRGRGIFCMRVECVRGVHVGVCVFIWS